MKQNAYAIKDAKTNTYGVPFFTHNDGTAERSFTQAANDPNTTIHQFPQDYALYRVGEFDDESGEIKPEKPVFISNAPITKSATEVATESIEKHL